MFCPECGKQVEEDKAFCKHCGTRLAPPSPTGGPREPRAFTPPSAPPTANTPAHPAPPATDPPPLPGEPRGSRLPATFPTLPSAAAAMDARKTVIEPLPFPPPAAQAAPPSAVTEAQGAQARPEYPPGPERSTPAQAGPAQARPQQPPFPAPQPAPPLRPPSAQPPVAIPYPTHAGGAVRGERPRWVLPLVAAMAVIIIGSLIGIAVVLGAGGGDSPRATGTVATGTTLGGDAASGPSTATTLEDGSRPNATIPSYDPDSPATSVGGGSAGGGEAGYVYALDTLDAVLSFVDARVPELAEEINSTAPNVPARVRRELERLTDDVLVAQADLASVDPPARFQRADDLLFRATEEMLYRLDQTAQGIDAMWAAGTVSAAEPYFDEGRKARDAYRRLFEEYRAARP